MSLFECILIYAVSWWLVLFMVLPWGVRPPQQPEKGHAASAPANPNIRRKLMLTSILSLAVPLLALAISSARAAPGIYHAGSNDCPPPVALAPAADVTAADSNATLNPAADDAFAVIPTFLDAPTNDFRDTSTLDRLSESDTRVGVITTDTKTGQVALNGVPLVAPITSSECR